MRMPGTDGIELLKRLKAGSSIFPVGIMTGHGDVPLAVEAMKLGAIDFLENPFEDDRLIGIIETAMRQAEPGVKSEAITLEITSRIATLSGRERQVMEGLIAGLSNKLIAREYDISPRRSPRAGYLLFTLRHVRLTRVFADRPAEQGRQRMTHPPRIGAGEIRARDERIGGKCAPLIGPQRLALRRDEVPSVMGHRSTIH